MENRITWLALDEIALWDANPNEGDIGEIIVSIQKHGFNVPVGIHDGIVYDGNHRVQALQQLQVSPGSVTDVMRQTIDMSGTVWKIPAVNLDHLTQQQAITFAIGANEIGRKARWEPEALLALIQEITEDVEDQEAALQGTGFDLEAIAELQQYEFPDDWKEYDESIENDVTYVECPHCGKSFPK